MNPIAAAALCPLSEKAQLAIIDLADVEANRALAASSSLAPAVAARLAKSGDITTALRALPRSNDVDHVSAVLAKGGLKATYAAKNPNLTVDELEKAAKGASDACRLAACINPTLPVSVRREVIDEHTAHRLVDVAVTRAGDVIRGYELALANRWMLETPGKWSLPVRRGLTALPEMTHDQYLEMKAAGYTRWTSMRTHPALLNIDTDQFTTAELIANGSAATDLLALGRSDLTADLVLGMVASGRREPEPHIVARVVSRFGPSSLERTGERRAFSTTADEAAAWSNPLVEYATSISRERYAEACRVVPKLGDDRVLWSLFASLAPGFIGDLEHIVEAATALR